MARYLLDTNLADAVWWVPCFQHPFAKQMSPAADRLAMLQKLATTNQPVCDYELTQTTPSYSYQTLQYWSNLQPENTFSWLIGSDQLADFPRWYAYQALLSHYTVYVYPRAGFSLAPLLPGMLPLSAAPVATISSTQVRQLVAQGHNIEHLVSPAVARYIQDHALYHDHHS